MAQAIKHPPSKCETLSPNPGITKTKPNQKRTFASSEMLNFSYWEYIYRFLKDSKKKKEDKEERDRGLL
jgi:hypothetical protein